MSFINTYTKKRFNPVSPEIEKIDIRDIAHPLSLMCRANGHSKTFYSVGQHSVNCCREALARGYSKRVALGCLLHDASEAYLSDITRPVKKELPRYLEIEKNMQGAIWSKWFNPPLSEDELKSVFEIDDAMLYFEFLVLMDILFTDKSEPKLCSTPNFDFTSFSDTENEFLNLFYDLTCESLSVGVDWKKGHWLAAELRGLSVTIKEYPDIASLCNAYMSADAIIIDIPIGLAEDASEADLRPDNEARRYLVTARKPSLFNAPFRPVIYAENTAEAWDINRTLGGKLTPQGLALGKIIRQADEFLQKNPQWKNKLLESHPEVAFQKLNGDSGLCHSKHTDEGIRERCDILLKYGIDIRSYMDTAKNDDIADAVSLALIGKLGTENGFVTIPEKVHTDKTGLNMQITLADI